MSLRDTLITDIFTVFGLSGKILYVSNKGSDSNNGLTESTAVLTVKYACSLAQSSGNGYIIYILGGDYTENLISIGNNALIGLNYPRIHDNSINYIIKSQDSTTPESAIVGVNIENNGTGTALNKGNSAGSYNAAKLSIVDCIINGDMLLARGGGCRIANSAFINSTWIIGTNGNTASIAVSAIENITFNNCADILLISNTSLLGENTKKIIAKNTSFTLEYNNDTLDDILNSVFDNCEFRFCNDEVWASVASSYSIISDASSLRAKRDSDLSITSTITMYDTCQFQSADFLDETNDNLFQNSINNYINNRHVGAYREAIYLDSTSMTAPAGGSVSNGYAESTAAPSTGIEFVCAAIEFSNVKKIKRIHALIDLGNGGEIMSSNTPSATKRSIDVDMCTSATKTAAELDASPETYSNYELGITDASTLEYGGDVDSIAKSAKFKFTLKNEGSSTDFGEVKVYQIILETEDAIWFENITEYLAPQQSASLANFADSVDNGELANYKLNINPQNSIRVQAVIDDGLTALTLPTGQKEFTIQELIALEGATFTGNYNIALYYLDANTLQYIQFTFDDGTTENMGTTENVT